MVLKKIINHGDDIFLPFGNGGNFLLKKGMEWINPPPEAFDHITMHKQLEVTENVSRETSIIYPDPDKIPDEADGAITPEVENKKVKRGRPKKNP